MRGVKRVALVLAVLIVTLVVLGFVLENQQGVSLSFLGRSTTQLPVAVFVVAALVIGMVIGPLFGILVRSRSSKVSPAGRG